MSSTLVVLGALETELLFLDWAGLGLSILASRRRRGQGCWRIARHLAKSRKETEGKVFWAAPVLFVGKSASLVCVYVCESWSYAQTCKFSKS